MTKEIVLKNKSDFDRLHKSGRSVGSRFVVLVYIKNGLDFNRRAFLSSKKVGKAVSRNRARRLMREAYRQIEPTLVKGYDLLFIARNTITENNCKCADVKKSIEAAVSRAGLISKTE
ncbi:MAG: ribonuclease P protein component [Ruminococcus sp.]|nr:ribonuclease P protein component [Ruminococcus sp.]